ncbi:MAG: hypothetical protein GY939_04275 [Actinomycetia bacterium]|nr:hypothetical protein [Actinomycetes bacterium]
MRIATVEAATVTDPTVLGRASGATSSLPGGSSAGGPAGVLADFMNPLAERAGHQGQGARFAPPWSDAVWSLIGGRSDRPPVPCYATGFDVDGYRELGFEAFKLLCPWGPDLELAVAEVEDLVGSTRNQIGADAPLMLDCWAVNDADRAIELGRALDPFDLGWLEDYLYPEDWPGYPRVRAALTGAVLAAGERWYTDRPFDRAVEEGWVDVVQPDVLWVGGATPTIRIAAAAATAGTRLAVHCGANDAFSQHLAYRLPGNEWAELYLGPEAPPGTFGSHRFTPGMALPVDGQLTPTAEPGFGIALTLDDLHRATS